MLSLTSTGQNITAEQVRSLAYSESSKVSHRIGYTREQLQDEETNGIGYSCLVIAAIRSLVSLSESFNNSLATSGCLSCSNRQFFSLSTHATVFFSA